MADEVHGPGHADEIARAMQRPRGLFLQRDRAGREPARAIAVKVHGGHAVVAAQVVGERAPLGAGAERRVQREDGFHTHPTPSRS
ncbi:hypothetical protein D3C83_52340 [compost metagenome]